MCYTYKVKQITLGTTIFSILSMISFAQDITYNGTSSGASLKSASDYDLPNWVANADNLGLMGTNVSSQSIIIDYATDSSSASPQFIIGGYSKNDTPNNVSNNQVNIKNGEIIGNIWGGLSHYTRITNDVNNSDAGTSASTMIKVEQNRVIQSTQNVVTLNAKTKVIGDIYGGSAQFHIQTGAAKAGNVSDSNFANATANTSVTIQQATIHTNQNTVSIELNTNINGSIYGGYGGANVTTGVATSGNASNANISDMANALSSIDIKQFTLTVNKNNVVIGSNANVTGSVYGGFGELKANAADVTSGNIDISNTTASTFDNALANIYTQGSTLTINENKVSIASNTAMDGSIYGGYGELKMTAGTATAGKVTINEIPQGVNANASIDVNDTTINIQNNTVTFNGKLNNGDIYGGYAVFDLTPGIANSQNGGTNDVTVETTGTTVNVTGNIVNIDDDAEFTSGSSLYGGYLKYNSGLAPEQYDLFTGNTLNYSAKAPATFDKIANFEHYKFTINPDYADKDIALITADEIILGTNPNNITTDIATASDISVVGIHSGELLNANDTLILMRATNTMEGNGAGIDSNVSVVQQGIAILYDVETSVDMDNKQVIATIKSREGGDSLINNAVKVNPQVKALSEGFLSSAMLVTRGTDFIAYDIIKTINHQNNGTGLIPFVTTSAQHNKYKSGSHIKSDDYLLSGGLSYQQSDVTLAAFLEAGWGDYDSYNSFNNAKSVHGNGDNKYYGLGLFGEYHFGNGTYTDASVRYGKTSNKFNTDDIQHAATGVHANYKLKSNYVSAHAGLGYQLPVDDVNGLDFSLKYLWTSIEGKSLNIAGDPFEFKRVNSNRLRFDTDLNHQYNEHLVFNTGLAYEYEFDGKAKGNVYHQYKIDAPSVKGSTGIFSLGTTYTPTKNGNLSLNAKVQGYVGKRQGGSLNLGIRYKF